MCGGERAAIKAWRASTHREYVFGVDVPEALHVIKDEPGERDYHQDDKGDGDEKN